MPICEEEKNEVEVFSSHQELEGLFLGNNGSLLLCFALSSLRGLMEQVAAVAWGRECQVQTLSLMDVGYPLQQGSGKS